MTKIGTNPNEKMPPGKPLAHDEIVSDDDDDGFGPANEDEDAPGDAADADVENQAGTEAVDTGKFQREPAEGGERPDGTTKR